MKNKINKNTVKKPTDLGKHIDVDQNRIHKHSVHSILQVHIRRVANFQASASIASCSIP